MLQTMYCGHSQQYVPVPVADFTNKSLPLNNNGIASL